MKSHCALSPATALYIVYCVLQHPVQFLSSQSTHQFWHSQNS